MPSEFEYIDPFVYEIGWRDIINDVQISVTERVPDSVFTTVWESDDTLVFSSGESKLVVMEAQDPFLQAQPVTAADGDIVFTGPGTPSVALSRLSGTTTTATITAVSGAMTISYLRLRARSVPVARTVQVVQTDSTSILKHGNRTYPNDVPFIGQHDALAVALLLLSQYAQRRPTVSVPIVSANLPEHLQEVSRTISDMITVRNSSIGLDSDFYIENIQHALRRMVAVEDCPGPVHYTTFGCEQAGSLVSVNPFTFDKTGAGFDDGAFGSSVADDPTTIFIFDHPTQGKFDVGRFAT